MSESSFSYQGVRKLKTPPRSIKSIDALHEISKLLENAVFTELEYKYLIARINQITLPDKKESMLLVNINQYLF